MTPMPWTIKLLAPPVLAAAAALVLPDEPALLAAFEAEEAVVDAPDAELVIDEDILEPMLDAMLELVLDFMLEAMLDAAAAVVPALEAETAQVADEGRFVTLTVLQSCLANWMVSMGK
jgi:hypothetical protein